MDEAVSNDKIITMKVKGQEEIMMHLSWGYSIDRATAGDHPRPR